MESYFTTNQDNKKRRQVKVTVDIYKDKEIGQEMEIGVR